MDPARSVDTARLRRDIDATRASITGTVHELRRKVGETMQWETYVERHPGPVLVGAALVGLFVGRRIARGLRGNDHPGNGPWTAGEASLAPALGSGHGATGAARLTAAGASWQRLGSRVEALVNRLIDEVADASERVIVPGLVGAVETLLEGRRTERRTPAPPRDRLSMTPSQKEA
jgi:hypothetical protein